MDYQWHYDRLIERARNRVLSGYVETHHVLPRCMGGGDGVSNLVQLTAEEHYVSHQLLCKMYPEERGLAFALQAMTSGNRLQGSRCSNKLFGWVRRRYALAQKGRIKSAEERANIAAAGRKRARRTFSAEARANMAAARRKTWEERRANGTDKLSAQKAVATRRANGSYKFSDEWKANICKASKGRPSPMKGRTTPPDVRLKQSEAAKRRWANHPGLAFPPGTGD